MLTSFKLLIITVLITAALFIGLINWSENKIDLFAWADTISRRFTGNNLNWTNFSVKKWFFKNLKALAANDTYVHRCDDYRFFTDVEHPTDRHFVKASNWSRREETWYKLKDIYPWVWHNLPVKYDWYFRLCDDTYVILENLRDYVKGMDPEQALYFGSLHKRVLPGGYITGNAIVFSRKSMQIIVQDILPIQETLCPTTDKMADDVMISMCLAQKQILPMDTRDSDGSQRFHPIRPENMTLGDEQSWYLRGIAVDKFQSGMAAFSKKSISFHYLTPFEFRWLDFLIYQLKIA